MNRKYSLKQRLYLKNKYGVDHAPIIRYFENGKETAKGKVDAELVLHAAARNTN
jgi:hypothetical protein